MATPDQIESLMAEVGPLLDPLEVASFPEESVWSVQIDEDILLLIDFDVAQDKLVLNCDVGQPPHGDRSRLYELMLNYNFHWDQTGGARLAVDAPGGNVVLIFDVPADELEITGFAAILENFTETARNWRQIVMSPPAEDASAFDVADSDIVAGSDIIRA
jgi:Tir chaperone family protein CesT